MPVAILQRYKIKSDYHFNTNVTVILEANYISKIAREKICKTTSGNELSVGKETKYRMVFEERRMGNNVVPGSCVEGERRGRNTGKGRCTLHEAEVKRILLNCLGNYKFRMNFLNKK
jgi:hypothetical protein